MDEAAALTELRVHARSIAARLGDEAICEALEVEPHESVSNERIASVYEILAQAEPEAIFPVDTDRELITANLNEEQEIGRAFKDDLLRGLAPSLKALVVYFADVPRVPRKYERRLLQTASVKAAWPESGGLVACGLTPLSVLYASRNVESLVRRLIEADILGEDHLTLNPLRDARHARDSPAPVSLSHRIAREVVQVNRCSEEAAFALVNWLIEVSKVKPLVFAGYRAAPEGEGIRLVPHEDYSDMPLDERWRETSSAARGQGVRPSAGARAAY